MNDLPKAVSDAMGGGWIGMIAGAIILALTMWASIQYRKAVKEAAERQKTEDQAKNPGQNSKADQDAANAEEEIEKVISGKDT